MNRRQTAKAWQTFIRLGLRALIVLIGAIGLGFGWLAHGLRASARPFTQSSSLAGGSPMIGSLSRLGIVRKQSTACCFAELS